MKSIKGRYVLAGMLILLLITGTVYGLKSNKLTFKDQLETGRVKIKVQQLTVTEDGECEAMPAIVEANNDVSYIPRITNLAADSYVRMKVEFTMNGECEEPLGVENIYGLGEGWIQKGDYFYYQKSLEKKHQVDLFDGIHTPVDWDPGDAEGFSIKITAEAIQSKNFYPDFASELPWGTIQLTEASKGNDVVLREATEIQDISYVEYTSSGGLECDSSDLFSQLKDMMPGDEYEKVIKVKNASDNPMSIGLDVMSDAGPLMNEIRLVIQCGDAQIYQGNVAEAIQVDDMNLVRLAAGESEDIKFTMYLPEGAENEFSELAEQVTWELTAEEHPEKAVQTSDFSNMVPYAVMLIIAGLIMALALRRKGHQ